MRWMKSAGSSHSKAVMNSWSSMPNEYVVWLWIVASWLRSRCARPSRAVARPRRANTRTSPSRTGRRRGRETRAARSCARGERSSRATTSWPRGRSTASRASRQGRRVSSARELLEIAVALGELPEEEVASDRTPTSRIDAEVLHPLRPRLDHLREGSFANGALLDRQPPPLRGKLVERVRDVLAVHQQNRSQRSLSGLLAS